METSKEIARFQNKPYSATCINIMARFVQIARHEEGEKIHLQDKNILSHISQIGQTTDNQHLRLLYQRLFEELRETYPAEQKLATQPRSFSSTLKSWGIGIK